MNNVNMIGAAEATKNLFKCLNIDLPDETPERFVKMIHDLTAYQNTTNKEIADIVNKTFEIGGSIDSKSMVLIKDIEAFSLCEHHIALMYDMKISVGYIPQEFVMGISKIVRLVDMVCKRLQLQEKIGNDIAEIMSILTKSPDIAVHIKAKHSCVTARGINNISAETVTTNFSGIFAENGAARDSFFSALK